MITHVEDPDEDRDDELVTLLRPGAATLAPQPGAFEQIRLGAARRRRSRAVTGGGLTLAVACAIAAPLYLTGGPVRVAPVTPLAPPAVSGSRAPGGTGTPAPSETVGPRPSGPAAGLSARPSMIPSPGPSSGAATSRGRGTSTQAPVAAPTASTRVPVPSRGANGGVSGASALPPGPTAATP